jgi:phage shock protein E
MSGLKRLTLRASRWSVLVALVIAGCGAPKTSDRDIVFVGVDDAEVLVQGKRNLFGKVSSAALIDPRSSYDFNEGHIPGALHVPYERAESEAEQLRLYDVVIVYGNDYNSAIALAMSKTLIEKGLKDVRTLRGGIRAWTDAGRELAHGPEG